MKKMRLIIPTTSIALSLLLGTFSAINLILICVGSKSCINQTTAIIMMVMACMVCVTTLSFLALYNHRHTLLKSEASMTTSEDIDMTDPEERRARIEEWIIDVNGHLHHIKQDDSHTLNIEETSRILNATIVRANNEVGRTP
jgi:hypothetical protein